MKTIRLKLAKIIFKLYKAIMPSYYKFSKEYNLYMFRKNEMCKSFPWKSFYKKNNFYYRKWGFDVSALDAEYYSQISNIRADHYVNRTMGVHFLYPLLSRFDLLPAYMDKNNQKRSLNLLEPDKELEVEGTVDIVCCSNGVFFDQYAQELTKEQAVNILTAYSHPMILKPSMETYGGHGVTKLEPNTDRKFFEDLFDKYNYDFTFQEIVRQHPDLAAFNSTSLNTVRIVTYRKPNRERKILFSCIRFGGPGAVIDNVCSGGGYTGIDIETGKLRDRRRYSYYTMEMPLLPDSIPNVIPCFEKIKKAALALHGRLPHFDIIGWDFSVTPEGHLTLIEYNLRPGVGLQQAVGPMFSKEDLDELMQIVSKAKFDFQPVGRQTYSDKSHRYISKFGFQTL